MERGKGEQLCKKRFVAVSSWCCSDKLLADCFEIVNFWFHFMSTHLITCQPNCVLTGFESSPCLRAKVAISNSLTIWPRENVPSRSCFWRMDTGFFFFGSLVEVFAVFDVVEDAQGFLLRF